MSPVGGWQTGDPVPPVSLNPERRAVENAVRDFLRLAAPGIRSVITYSPGTHETQFALSFLLELTAAITDETIMSSNGRAVQDSMEQAARMFRDYGIRGLGLEARIEERVEQERKSAVDAAMGSVMSKVREHARGVSHENHLILTGVLAEVSRDLSSADAVDRDRERIREVLEKVATLSAESLTAYPDEAARLADVLWELVR